MSTDTDTEAQPEPSWHPDEDQRWLEGQRRALTNGQEVAARTAEWWMSGAAILAGLRAEAERHLPKTTYGWEEWFELGKVRTHVNPEDVFAFLDQLVAGFDSIAGDYRREGQRLRKEQEIADQANADAAAKWAAQNAGNIGA